MDISISERLGGFGAALQGNLPAFEEQRRRERSDTFDQQQTLSEERSNALLQDAFKVNAFIKQRNPGAAVRLLQQRIGLLKELGGEDADVSDTQPLLEMLLDGNIKGAFEETNTVVEFAMRSGLLTPEGGVPGTANQRDFAEFSQNFSEEDKELARRQQLGIDPKPSNRLSAAQEGAIAEAKAVGTGRGSAGEGRRADTIEAGIGGAKSLPVFRRTLDLLDSIRTSGFDNAVLAAKRLFGVEGADEGELSANLGRAVLSQLRPIFGAQFTQKEGERLESIEAGFNKSVVNNRRLIRQLMVVAEDSAKRALRADPEAREVQKINDFLSGEFDLSDERLADVFTTRGQREAQGGLPAPAPGTPAAPQGAPVFRGFRAQ